VSRGDIVTVALRGESGKPRPAVVVQSDAFRDHSTVTVLPLTSDIVPSPAIRILVEPTMQNGLRKLSQIMIDKTQTVAAEKVRAAVGRLEAEQLLAVDRALASFLGLA
jgi:mRNA interferase MazF